MASSPATGAVARAWAWLLPKYMICAATHFAYLGQSAVMRSKGLKPSEPPMP